MAGFPYYVGLREGRMLKGQSGPGPLDYIIFASPFTIHSHPNNEQPTQLHM
jgi:hypothetical protein